tara:strand:- start:676 stop:915 length:240 start_codon:yes stop_codon:yes gene_type:complete
MSSPLSDLEQDQALQSFIALARSDSEVRELIKQARNQDEIIDIAQERGFNFDSMALLRQWSQHTDFSKPTWMGWFDDES